MDDEPDDLFTVPLLDEELDDLFTVPRLDELLLVDLTAERELLALSFVLIVDLVFEDLTADLVLTEEERALLLIRVLVSVKPVLPVRRTSLRIAVLLLVSILELRLP
ncbi:MAG: hypothetical protein ACFCU6_15755 [Balneolaceae bacterium]